MDQEPTKSTQAILQDTPIARFWTGFRALSPIVIGVIPFAMIAGIAAIEVGLSPLEGQSMSLIVFAGAAQLAGMQLIDSGATPIVMILTVWIINLRFMLYSASLGQHFKNIKTIWKAILAFILTDQAYAVSILEFEKNAEKPHKHWYYFGAAVLLWITWQLGTAAGLLLGTEVPESWSLDFAIPLTFIALLVPALKDRPAAFAALAAAVVVVLALGLPYNLGLPLAALAGIGVGMFTERGSQ
ncbi:MAG: branched-chain amino acid ABC transporter permease [Chloroflexi bacterium]|nr:MAG: branched-chain amino acid ABC transporter permease [Chloroflexota bacterium]MBL1197307.1 branched-chain amino acid ABC transporter permease [Chloroflexota bacterium]NOH14603.1 AzlC family ABC transporter permease [Chloroflexota bacterium]